MLYRTMSLGWTGRDRRMARTGTRHETHGHHHPRCGRYGPYCRCVGFCDGYRSHVAQHGLWPLLRDRRHFRMISLLWFNFTVAENLIVRYGNDPAEVAV